MAALDVIVNKFVSLWRKPNVQRHFAALFLLISLSGSALKELDLVPETYFSSSRNVLNVYFVKVSWGWTLLLLTPFLLLSNSSLKRNVTFLGRRLLSLVVATVIWYVTTETFFYIEDLTGFCHETGAPEVGKENFTSKADCRRAGFHWNGWDISGHCFILTYSTLLIVEEMAPMVSLRTAGLEGGHRRQSALPRMVLSLLYVALNLIVIIWVWMFACTSVYFHDPLDKFLGTVCALLGWYLTYGVWYQRPMSPGLPPKIDPREDKRYA